MEAPRIHIVQAGDSLSSISQKYFGNFSMVDVIAEENGITNKALIYPGQQLSIPALLPEVEIRPKNITKVVVIGLGLALAAAAGWYYYQSEKKKQAKAA